jgi:MFS family permease
MTISESDANTLRKATVRLVPFLGLIYFFAFFDRVNIAFAAIQMNASLGLTPALYGLASGIFFLGYVAFQIPSSLILRKIGTRQWITAMVLSWGILSTLMGLTHSIGVFLTLRFLLGLAEAGVLPAVLLYFARWYPAAQRGKIVAMFLLSIPFAQVVGAPLAAHLLGLSGLGLAGWQWLFLASGIPNVVLGVITWFVLPEKPEDVRWLSREEKTWLGNALSLESKRIESAGLKGFSQVWRSPIVVLLGCIYFFGPGVGLFGMGFWMPLTLKGFGLATTTVGWIVSFIYLLSALWMVVWSRHSDATKERVWHVAACALIGFVTLSLGGLLRSDLAVGLGLAFAMILVSPITPTFWSLPARYLTGRAATVGFPAVAMIGNLGGFAGPYFVGLVKQQGGQTSLAMILLALPVLICALLTLTLLSHPAIGSRSTVEG